MLGRVRERGRPIPSPGPQKREPPPSTTPPLSISISKVRGRSGTSSSNSSASSDDSNSGRRRHRGIYLTPALRGGTATEPRESPEAQTREPPHKRQSRAIYDIDGCVDPDLDSDNDSETSSDGGFGLSFGSVFGDFSSPANRSPAGSLPSTPKGPGAPLSPRLLDTAAYAEYSESVFCKDEGGIYGRDRHGRKNGFVYFLGIIDILQQYNTRKIAETFFKGLRHNRKQISAVNPDFYGDRFIEFMEKHVVQDDTLISPRPRPILHDKFRRSRASAFADLLFIPGNDLPPSISTFAMLRSFGFTCAFAAALVAVTAQPSYVYKFDAATAGGVDGSIQVKYAGEDSSTATITASLDFSGVDQAEIAAFDGNCTEAVTSYKWHIHTKWNSTLTSDSFKQCSKAATDNHYDPLRACGTASEYIAEPECKAKSLNYACNPANYMNDPLACEKGDLSGKFGAFKLSEDSTVSAEWTDENYPLPSENTDTWSIVLHAVCGKEAPRISCAVGTKAEGDASQVDQFSPVQSSPNQSTGADCSVKA
ncbi:unnamed protein product [Phytophthora lilii]|uniref:Unnamed protein product n=1 Tax=Phytophthora lilii TaxID=2077276 RepID=A0A9W6YIE2_9STRA|nr:unnamed protein product [Phytophthora lilii]